VPQPPTAKQIEQNLTKAAAAHGKGRKAFDAALDGLFPEKNPIRAKRPQPTPSCNPRAPRRATLLVAHECAARPGLGSVQILIERRLGGLSPAPSSLAK
jgi:hypothetical protein